MSKSDIRFTLFITPFAVIGAAALLFIVLFVQ